EADALPLDVATPMAAQPIQPGQAAAPLAYAPLQVPGYQAPMAMMAPGYGVPTTGGQPLYNPLAGWAAAGYGGGYPMQFP
ncbi:hypothetical protein GGF38_003785, partial [Coemansia sp. RSA 25]